jgi:hypothetical protein
MGHAFSEIATMPRPWLILALLCCMLARSSGQAARVLPQDAYVWQRHWTPALADAMRQSADLVQAWRILAAEVDSHGTLQPVAIDWQAVRRSGRPVVLVVRIDGSAADPDAPALIARLAAMPAAPHGDVPIAGLEIDHDCATARLGGYAAWLAALRARLDPALRLSITALPTWLSSPELPRVLDVAAEVVLQVHAVQDPRAGLFDAATARGWIDAFARRSDTPFRVALPTYGARVSWDADGALRAIESERPLLAGGARTAALVALPDSVAALLRGLQADPPRGLRGIVWFRLPTARDRLAWSLATWRAVAGGAAPPAAVAAQVRPGNSAGLQQLVLANDGALDAPLPRAVVLPARCTLADGIGGYALAYEKSGLTLRRQDAGLLHGHARQVIGWTRCTIDAADLQVEP